MAVMDPVREINEYSDHWHEPKKADVKSSIEKDNNKHSRFLYYPWGLYVTAYCRRAIFKAIIACGEDYVYSDTDSVKFRNYEKHKKFFDQYNKQVEKRLKYALNQQNIPFEYATPKTIKGEVKMLGIFEFEGVARRFKTLGAKRYLYEDRDGELHLTVSGVNKKIAVPYLLDKYGDNDAVFKQFKDGLFFPAGASGKQTHTYIDTERTGTIEDYQGNVYEYHEKTGIHLEPAEYKLSIHGDFNNYLISLMKGI